MSKLIHALKIEHIRMMTLLSLMEREVARFQEGNVLDYFLISSILDYLNGVGHYKLHIAEEEIYKRLKLRDADRDSILGDVPMAHKKLSFLRDALDKAVQNVEQDNDLPRMWLVSVAAEFCSAMRHHLELEDRALFPLAISRLRKEDWDAIGKIVAENSDPDVTKMESKALHELHDEILQWERGQPFI